MNTGFSNVVKACGVVVSALMVACSGAAQRPAAVAAAEPAQACQGDTVYGNAALERVRGCSEIEGDLRISGVTSLEPLAGLTQVQLAKRLKQSQSFVTKMERGDRRIDVVQLRTICRIYGLTLSEFVARLEAELGSE